MSITKIEDQQNLSRKVTFTRYERVFKLIRRWKSTDFCLKKFYFKIKLHRLLKAFVK